MTRIPAAAIFRTTCWLASLIFFGVLAAACGGSSDDEPAPAHPPTITNLRYSPASAAQVPGGTVTINGTFDFSDAGGDVATVRMTSSGGVDVSTPTPQLAGIAAGTVTGQVVVSADQPGKYTFEMWVTDGRGMSSNRLAGTFEVLAPPPQPVDHAPVIANLTFSPVNAAQSSGGTAWVMASVSFTDAGKDVARLDVIPSWAPAESFSALDKQGLASGTILFHFGVPLSQPGSKTFEVVVLDSQGNTSIPLSGTFDVLAPSTHPPAITRVDFVPSSVTRVLNGTAVVTWIVGFTDAGGDVSRIRIIGPGIDTAVETPQLAGVVAGETRGTVSIPVGQAGVLTFETWAMDGQGSASNRASSTIDVWAVEPAGTLYGIAWDGRRYVAVGAGGVVRASSDLANWTTSNAGVGHVLRSIASSPHGFVAVGDVGSSGGEGVVLTSNDGTAWTVRYRAGQCTLGVCASPARLSKVIWAGSQFVAVGDERSTPDKVHALILTSPDGITWTQRAARTIVVGDPEYISPLVTSVVWSGTQFVAVGLDGTDLNPKAWRSTNLDDWTAAPIGPDPVAILPVADITWGDGRFVVVGPPGIYNRGAASYGHAPTFASLDAITWQAGPTTQQLPPMSAVAAGGGRYMAVGDGYREASADGLNWTVTPMSGCGKGVLWDGIRFVAVGETICVIP